MIRLLHTRFSTAVLALFLLLMTAFPVSAQGAPRQILLSVFEASPGATIEVSGAYFEPDILITFILTQNNLEIPLGTIFADEHGDFAGSVLLPYDLVPGQYEFRAVDEKTGAAAVPLAVVPDQNQVEGGELRDEDDGLLSPMPTYAPGVVPGGEVPKVQAPPAESDSLSLLMLLTVLGVIGILAVAGMWVLRRR